VVSIPITNTNDIYVDGIHESKQSEYANELRAIGIRVRRVHRLRDESSALIRLTDSLAGLARQVTEGNDEAIAIIRQALKKGVIAEL
jgi:hypothetical protein